MQWITKKYNQLSLDELYDILKVRLEVFSVEQNCPYQDCDGHDRDCLHLFGVEKNEIVAYSRIAGHGVIYPEASIGRVLTSKPHRGVGLGKELFKKSLEVLEANYSGPVKIMAQSYLIKFYNDFGFKVVSEEFLEDGLPHHYMIKEKGLLPELNSYEE